MPFRELRLYINNYDSIVAEENINNVSIIGIGTGSMGEEDSKPMLQKWFDAADRKDDEKKQVAQHDFVTSRNPFNGVDPDEIGKALEKSPRWKKINAPQQSNASHPLSPPGSNRV